MNLRSFSTAIAISLFTSVFLLATTASADIIVEDPDIEACYGKSEAETCLINGELGLCEPDEANRLRCKPVANPSEDEPPATDDDKGSCATVLANPIVTPVVSFLLGLMILAGVRRRNTRES
jgi:hypothetical protein